MASTLGLYSAILLSVSRIPEVMSEDGLLHKKLQSLHLRFKTPYISIIICSIVVSGMILWAFEELLIIDITVYGAALFLEFIALVILRRKLPEAKRPFKIPLNVWGLCIMILLPLSVYVIALSAAFMESGKTLASALFALISLLSAELIWRIILLRKGNVGKAV
jgi:amino acid transporter